MPDTGRPYLSMAVLCEKVLQEPDGVPSLVRIVDRVIINTVPPTTISSQLGTQTSSTISLTLALMFKAGAARGQKALTIRLSRPSGLRLPETTLPLLFEGDDDRGINIFLPFVLGIQEMGIYWFDLDLDGELVGRIPLRIVNQQVSVSTPPILG